MRLLVVLLVAACAPLTEPGLELAGMAPTVARQSYPVYWARVEACSHTTGDLAGVAWYVMPTARFTMPGHGDTLFAGAYFPRTQRIIMGAGMDTIPQPVEHEMLHALLHTVEHPRVFQTCNVPA